MSEGEMSVELSSIRCAKKIAKIWGRPWLWREYLCFAYLGVRRARERGKKDNMIYLPALSAVRDGIRDENQSRRIGRKEVRFHSIGINEDFIAPEIKKDPANEMLEAWCNTRRQRECVNLRYRLVAYLHLVEGFTLKKVAEMLGVVESYIWVLYARFKAAMRETEEQTGNESGYQRGVKSGIQGA